MRMFIEQLATALESSIGPYLDQKVYVDDKRLMPGYNFDEALFKAICQSICMVVVYSPRYEDHIYCLREYTAMERIEMKRKVILGNNASNEVGMILTRLGEVITFYSYKGGTGRSMALSNIACLLAKRRSEARGVLVIDWDLEAPGLHRFFYNDLQRAFVSREVPARALDEHPGLIDLFLELEALGLTRLHGPIGVKRSCSVKGVEDGLERQALLA